MVSTAIFKKRVLSLPFTSGYEIIPFSPYTQFNEFNKLVSENIGNDVIYTDYGKTFPDKAKPLRLPLCPSCYA